MTGPAIGSVYFNHYLTMSLREKHMHLRDGLTAKIYGRLSAEERANYKLRRSMVEALNRTLAWDPHHPQANLRLASCLLSSFEFLQQFNENAMSLSQIRDAATASEFPSPDAVHTWLKVAIGDNLSLLIEAQLRVLDGLAWSPLEGRGYLQLADLAFLECHANGVANSLRRQAEQVSPHDAAIIFAAGKEAALAGNVELAMKYWKRAYDLDEDYRKPIMEVLGTRLPAPFFIEQFKPDRSALCMLHKLYQEQGMSQQVTLLTPSLIDALEAEAGIKAGQYAARLLMQSVALCRSLEDGSRAVKNARLAVERAPNLFDTHRVLAQQLMIEKQYDEAIEQLVWCARIRPSDQQLKQAINAARNARRHDRGVPARTVSRQSGG